MEKFETLDFIYAYILLAKSSQHVLSRLRSWKIPCLPHPSKSLISAELPVQYHTFGTSQNSKLDSVIIKAEEKE